MFFFYCLSIFRAVFEIKLDFDPNDIAALFKRYRIKISKCIFRRTFFYCDVICKIVEKIIMVLVCTELHIVPRGNTQQSSNVFHIAALSLVTSTLDASATCAWSLG